MIRPNNSILENVFKINDPEKLRKILLIEHGVQGPVILNLLSRPHLIDKTLALGQVVETSLLDLVQNKRNLFNHLLTQTTPEHFAFIEDLQEQNHLESFFILLPRLRKDFPHLYDKLVNSEQGYLPLSTMINNYSGLIRKVSQKKIEEAILSFIEKTHLNVETPQTEHLLNSFFTVLNQSMNFSVGNIQYFLNIFDICIDKGLDINTYCGEANTPLMNILKIGHVDLLDIVFNKYFNQIDFTLKNDKQETILTIDALNGQKMQDKLKAKIEKNVLEKIITKSEKNITLKI